MIDDNRLLPLTSPRADLDRSPRDLAQPPGGNYVGSYSTGKTVAADQAHLRDYIKIVLKRKWLILSIALVVTSITAIYMFRQPSVYEAQTRILIEPRQKSFLQRAEININAGATDPAYRPTQIKLIQNPALIRLAVQRLGLPDNPAFFREGGRAGLLSAVRRAVGKKPEQKQAAGEGGLDVVNEPGTEDAALADPEGTQLTAEQRARLEPYEDAILADLTVAPVEKTNLIDISYRHTDPKIAADVANTIADIFIAQDTFRGTFGTASQKERLARQVIELQQEMQQLQQQRIQYMRENNIPLGGAKGQNEVALQLETTSGYALAAQKARKDLQAAYEAAQRTSDIMSLPQVLENKSIQAMQDRINGIRQERAVLLLKYTEQNPRVIEKDEQIRQLEKDIRRTARQTVEGIGIAYKAAIENEARYNQSYAQTRIKSSEQSTAELMLGDLNQKLETAKQFFNTASQRLKEMEISGDQLGPNSITVQMAAREPREPVGPQRGRNIVVALLLSLGAGVGLSILLENLDDTLKSVEDVDRYIHVPTLALIPAPRLERKSLRSGKSSETALQPATAPPLSALALVEDPRSVVAEAYRHLRTSLLLSSAGHPPKSVLVTSSQPSEGKTTTAVNTAVTLAQTGAEVLIIDCDLRRPRIHVHFGLANARGLTNYLAGDASLDDVIQPFEKMPNLKVMASGPVPPNPAELLGSEEMRKLVRELSGRFAHIIIDSPPAISFTDAAILSTIVDGVMLVVHGGRSSRAVVRRARQQLLDVGAHIYGVVLNNVKLEANDYNYYTGYYGSGDESTDDERDDEYADDDEYEDDEELVGSAADDQRKG